MFQITMLRTDWTGNCGVGENWDSSSQISMEEVQWILFGKYIGKNIVRFPTLN